MGRQADHSAFWRVWLFTWVALLAMGAAGCKSSNTGGNSTPGDGGSNLQLHPCANGDAPCATGTVCEPFAGCVACVFDSDCKSGEWCHANSCVALLACTSDADCTSDAALPACDPHRGACVPCTNDSHCGAAAHCVNTECQPYTPCTSSADCTGGMVCDTGAKQCVGCNVDADCAADSVCLNAVCHPKCTTSTSCAAEHQVCGALGACVECSDDADCPAVYHCDENKCLVDVCKAGSVTCDSSSNGTFTCRPDGRSYTAAACASGTSCDPTSGSTCNTWKCSPGMQSCDLSQNTLVQCAPDGLTSTVAQACAADEVCTDIVVGDGGVTAPGCAKQICTPNQAFCDTPLSHATCSPDGTAAVNPQACTSGEHCENGGCVANVCVPDAVTCDNNMVKTCDSVGAGYISPPTKDCTATGQICDNADCADIVCVPSSFLCGSDGNRYQCNTLGTASTLVQTCTGGTICDATNSAFCTTIVCTPGQAVCDVDRLTTCNGLGTGPLPAGGTDCTVGGGACYGGACAPVICTGNSICVGQDALNCINRGTATSLKANCLSTQYCYASGGTASCPTDLCTNGQLGCTGQTIGTCLPDGSGFDTSGADCTASNATCISGACVPWVCAPGDHVCSSGNVVSCNSTRTGYIAYQTCTSAQYCNPGSGTNAICTSDICAQGLVACSGETLAVCNADGSGFTNQTTDCSATGEVCNEAVACSATALDTFGSASSVLTTSSFYGNEYQVNEGRTLTQIEQYVSLSTTLTLTWVVYESISANGTYTLISQTPTTAFATAQFVSSGPISVPLVAGKFYVIGAFVSGGTRTLYSSLSTASQFVSFGKALVGVSYSGVTPPSSFSPLTTTREAYMRLTTAP